MHKIVKGMHEMNVFLTKTYSDKPLFFIRKSFGIPRSIVQRIVSFYLHTGSATDKIPEFLIGVASVCSVCFLFGIGMLYR